MAAHIQQSVDAALRVAHDDDRLARHLEQEVVAFFRDLALVADVEPGLQEDMADFLLVDLGIAVHAAGQRVALPVAFQ